MPNLVRGVEQLCMNAPGIRFWHAVPRQRFASAELDFQYARLVLR
jgi:hypothetical protein